MYLQITSLFLKTSATLQQRNTVRTQAFPGNSWDATVVFLKNVRPLSGLRGW